MFLPSFKDNFCQAQQKITCSFAATLDITIPWLVAKIRTLGRSVKASCLLKLIFQEKVVHPGGGGYLT